MKRHVRMLVALLLVVPMLVTAYASPAAGEPAGEEVDFVADLLGSNVVPPVATSATGVATLHVNGSSLDFLVATNGLVDISQAHIHLGAAGSNGPVEAFLFGFASDGVNRDGTLSRGTLTEAQLLTLTMSELITALRTGGAYVQVHTAANPAGETRGQITPLTTPAGGFFTDTAGSVHATNIDKIAAASVTLGCNPPANDEFCTADSVTRGEMAAFMSRAFNLPASATDAFTDDDGSIFEADINAIAAAGITTGCNPPANTNFCPGDSVSRGQMATFLVRALGLSAGGSVDMFGDDNGSVHESNINRIGIAGITQGTAPGVYSPNDPTSRAQMATFLSRALGWTRPSVPEGFSLTVLHNNDGESELLFDGEYGGVARFKALLDQERAAATTDGTVLLSSGDNFLASPDWTASLEKGIPFYDSIAMNRFGYDAIALGNHDFDFGPDVTAEFILGFSGLATSGLSLQAAFDVPPFLSSNLDFSAEPNLQALVDSGRIAASTMLTVNGQKIGVVGATTPDLPSISSPRNIVVGADVAGAVQTEVDSLTAAGADIIILISHLQDIDADMALAPNIRGVDIMIAGGGDELLANPSDVLVPGDTPFGPYPLWAIDNDGRQLPVVTTSGQYFYLGRLVTQFDRAGQLVGIEATSGTVRVSGVAPDAVTADAFLQAAVEDPVTAFVSGLAADVIGTSEVALDGSRDPGVRSMETNEGNLIADGLLSTGKALAASFGVASPDVALQNGGGIRNDSIIPAGDITRLDTFDMVPFPNFVTIVPDIPRSQFKEILENAVSRTQPGDTPGGTGRFTQIAGFSFTWSSSGTAQVLDGDGMVTTPGTRVTEVVLDDSTVIVTGGVVMAGPDLAIATIDFLARGGDEYPYRGASFTPLGVSYQQAVADLIIDVLGGTITAADYPEGGEGRITNVA